MNYLYLLSDCWIIVAKDVNELASIVNKSGRENWTFASSKTPDDMKIGCFSYTYSTPYSATGEQTVTKSVYRFSLKSLHISDILKTIENLPEKRQHWENDDGS